METGLGGLCRDDRGNWVKGFREKYFCRNSKEAELKAVITGIQWAQAEGWNEFIIASDCKQIVEEINSLEESRDQLTRMTNLCRTFLGHLRGTIMFEKREANAPADEIAKQARLDSRTYFNLECILTPSPVCMELIKQDRMLEPEAHNSHDSSCRQATTVGARALF
ncbi:hypothetical protein BVRB_6g154320 [Beta vulgaris subsp. vulgaris]|nr:hypothetical protein BVRB_6g154320 [Beta vulgaris subsp. vulgaris]